MRATLMYGAGDVRIESIPDAAILHPTDALIRVRACVCGSDLWPYNEMPRGGAPRPMGHEAIGLVEAVGAEVRRIKVGDLVDHPLRLLGRLLHVLPREPADVLPAWRLLRRRRGGRRRAGRSAVAFHLPMARSIRSARPVTMP